MDNITEYRGIRGLVAAILEEDSKENLTYETPFYVAGSSELTKETETSSETHYYDNMAAIVIDSVGADTVNVNVSAVPLDVVAKLTGQKYDTTTKALIEGEAIAPYCAMGYITDDTDGNEIYVWRYKGKFTRPGSTHKTKNNGTDADGQTLTYTGITTTHPFKQNENKGAHALCVPAKTCGKTEEKFFEQVMTPDDIITVEG